MGLGGYPNKAVLRVLRVLLKYVILNDLYGVTQL